MNLSMIIGWTITGVMGLSASHYPFIAVSHLASESESSSSIKKWLRGVCELELLLVAVMDDKLFEN